jgi:hypothetical protein
VSNGNGTAIVLKGMVLRGTGARNGVWERVPVDGFRPGGVCWGGMKGEALIKELARELTAEELPEGYRQMAAVVGVENTLKLAEYLGGMHVYFPKLDSLMKRRRDERIRREFTGLNHRELARKYGLTEKWVRKIVQRGPSRP